MNTKIVLTLTQVQIPTQELMDELTAIVFGDHEQAQRQEDAPHDWMLGSANDWWATLLGGVLTVDSRLPYPEKHAAIRSFLEIGGATLEKECGV